MPKTSLFAVLLYTVNKQPNVLHKFIQTKQKGWKIICYHDTTSFSKLNLTHINTAPVLCDKK